MNYYLQRSIEHLDEYESINFLKRCIDKYGYLKENITNTNNNLTVVHGNLLSSGEEYIVQQINSTGRTLAGLSQTIGMMYPESNLYNGPYKQTNRPPGNIIITNNRVINIIGQKSPGKPKHGDTAEDRENWFRTALNKIPVDIKSIAFPYGIGCGLAGGNWQSYYQMIKNFAMKNPQIDVKIYKI